MNVNENEQLKDVTITIGVVEYDDEDKPYATSYTFKGDLTGSIAEWIQHVSSGKQLVALARVKEWERIPCENDTFDQIRDTTREDDDDTK